MINIAYVGFGKSTGRYHLPYIQQRLDKFSIKRVVTPTLGKRPELQQMLENTGTIFSTDIADIKNDSSIDLVVVVTPTPSHFQIAKELLEVGKNVLVDKPIAKTVGEVDELIKLADKNQKLIMPFQTRRFDSDFLTVKRVLEKGYIGRLIELETHMDHFRPDDIKHSDDVIGGSIFDHGVHLVDQVVSLFGQPNSAIYNFDAVRDINESTEDQFEIQLNFPNKLKVSLNSSESTLVQYPKWVLNGTRGTFIKYGVDQQENDLKQGILPDEDGFGIDSPEQYGKVTFYNQNGDLISKQIPTINGDYGRIYDNVYDVLTNNHEQIVNHQEMRSVIEILSSAFISSSPSIVHFQKK